MGNTAMHDPYEIRSGSSDPSVRPPHPDAPESTHQSPRSVPEPNRRNGASNPVSVLLWTLAAILAGTNTALSIAGREIIGSFAGAGALICLTILLVRHLRRRR